MKFDRYSCLTCFEGAEAERRVRLGKEQEGDKEKIEKLENHQLLFRHQFEEAKKEMEAKDPSKLLILYDYTTVHDLTTEKVLLIVFVVTKNNKKTKKQKQKQKQQNILAD